MSSRSVDSRKVTAEHSPLVLFCRRLLLLHLRLIFNFFFPKFLNVFVGRRRTI